MKSSLIHRIACVLQLILAARHTFGFRGSEPGLFVSVLSLFAAFALWQVSELSAAALLPTLGIAWAQAVCIAIVTILSWRYSFVVPLIFSMFTAAALIAGAWALRKAS